MRKLACLAYLVVAFSAPSQAQDFATVQRLADQFAEAFNKNGAAGVGEMYADEAILVPPEADIRMGRRDIQAFWTQQARQGENLAIIVLDLKPLGTDAARALVRSEMTTKGPRPQQVTGRNVAVLQRVGTDWKLSTHTWNYDRGSSQRLQETRRGSLGDRSDPADDREGDRDDEQRYSERDTGRADREGRRSWDRRRDEYRPRDYDRFERRSWQRRDYD